MAKASDLLGKSGSGGFQPQKPKLNLEGLDKKEGADHSATKQRPVMDSKPNKSGGPSGGAPTSVRPKV